MIWAADPTFKKKQGLDPNLEKKPGSDRILNPQYLAGYLLRDVLVGKVLTDRRDVVLTLRPLDIICIK